MISPSPMQFEMSWVQAKQDQTSKEGTPVVIHVLAVARLVDWSHPSRSYRLTLTLVAVGSRESARHGLSSVLVALDEGLTIPREDGRRCPQCPLTAVKMVHPPHIHGGNTGILSTEKRSSGSPSPFTQSLNRCWIGFGGPSRGFSFTRSYSELT